VKISEQDLVINLETSFEALLTDGLSFQLVNHGFVTSKWISLIASLLVIYVSILLKRMIICYIKVISERRKGTR